MGYRFKSFRSNDWDQDILSSLDSSTFHPSVILTDGYISCVQGTGATNAIFLLSLSYVLYVLKFSLICHIYFTLSDILSHALCISKIWNKKDDWHITQVSRIVLFGLEFQTNSIF